MHPVIMAAMAFLAGQPPRISIAGALLFGLVGLSNPALAGWSFFCPPSTGASYDQLRLVFIKWARDHPEEMHKGSRATVLMALAGAFPCEQ